MNAEGREYAIAVRGDPVSGTSLLSTSIQTAMLYGRIMDPPGRSTCTAPLASCSPTI